MKKQTEINYLTRTNDIISMLIKEADERTADDERNAFWDSSNDTEEDDMDDEETDESNLSKYRVNMERTVTSYVVVLADSQEEAEEMVQIGIEVKEDGSLSAR